MEKLKKGELTLKILEKVDRAAMNFFDISVAILTSPHRASFPDIQRRRRAVGEARQQYLAELTEKQRLRSLIYKLKKEGLLEAAHPGWLITEKGKEKLRNLKNKLIGKKIYEKETDNQLKIIIFDIPENYRKERVWLRFTLRQFGFALLQKSVWVGKFKIPPEFIEDLRIRKIINYVHVLSVNRKGTLENLV